MQNLLQITGQERVFYQHKTDNENIHPTHTCQKRYLHATMAIKRNTTLNTNLHFDDNCQICDIVKSLSKGVIGDQEITRRTKNILVADQHPKSLGSNLFNTHYTSQFHLILSFQISEQLILMNTRTLRYHYVYVDFVQMFLGDLLEVYVNIYFAFPVLQNI